MQSHHLRLVPEHAPWPEGVLYHGLPCPAPPLPPALATAPLLSVSVALPALGDEVMRHGVSVSDSFPFSVMFLRLVHVVAKVSASLLSGRPQVPCMASRGLSAPPLQAHTRLRLFGKGSGSGICRAPRQQGMSSPNPCWTGRQVLSLCPLTILEPQTGAGQDAAWQLPLGSVLLLLCHLDERRTGPRPGAAGGPGCVTATLACHPPAPGFSNLWLSGRLML